MLSKESKIRVLENFYALDYVFFGKPAARVESCCPLLKEEYLSIKGALLSVFVEMLKLVDHNPSGLEEQVNTKLLMQSARQTAQTARENAQRIVSTDKSRANIKEILKAMIKEDKTLDISATIESQIRTKAFGLAVDNLLLARVVSEAKSFDKLNEWEGTIIEDSYKILRDNLIESAYEILYTESDESLMEEMEWDEAVQESAQNLVKAGSDALTEDLTSREKKFLFGPIQNMFGACASKCGRITIRSQANSCKDMCIAKRDKAIKLARAKAKGQSDKAAAIAKH